jgi:cystathionine gamma-lyase
VAAKDAGYAVTMIDMLDFNGVVAAIRPETKMIWIETPTNPTLRITDIQTISQAIKSIRKDVWIVVDNTFMTAINQLPLTLGADIVVHSVTKYLNGHCDVVMGIAVTNDPAIAKRLKFMQNAIGAVPSPFDCWLALRGMKTLALRMRAHNQNALKVAQFLESHSKIAHVKYPGLPSHPQHQIALKQHIQGHGGMIAFHLKSNNLQDSITLTQSTQIFTLAESLGGIESLIEVPAIMTHASVPAEQLNLLGISNGFIRISCGIEDVQDLIDDLSQALNSIQ